MPEMSRDGVAESVDALAHSIHDNVVAHGFWPGDGRNIGEALMLVVSEVAEAMESNRAGEPTLWWKHEEGCESVEAVEKVKTVRVSPGCHCRRKPEGLATELADVVIRSLDLLHEMIPKQVDMTPGRLIVAKHIYNCGRPFKHGKRY